MNIYVDESIHSKLCFICTAFVFSDNNIEKRVDNALLKVGMKPGIDEFKSGAYMENNQNMQDLRTEILGIAGQYSKIAVLFTHSNNRENLGNDCIKFSKIIMERNGIDIGDCDLFFDEGIISNSGQMHELSRKNNEYAKKRPFSSVDSKTCRGIQVADVVAHSIAQVIRQDLSLEPKHVDISGPDTGYETGTIEKLEWHLRMQLRKSFFSRPVIYKDQKNKIEEKRNPHLISEDEDIVNFALNPELIGWGVFVNDDIDSKIKNSIFKSMNRIWLGCIH